LADQALSLAGSEAPAATYHQLTLSLNGLDGQQQQIGPLFGEVVQTDAG
jgi:hypothetical protein